MSVFVTGDIHGSFDIRKLGSRKWLEGRELTRDDYLVILGDFGLIWKEKPSSTDRWWSDWLENMPWTTLWLDGNHDNHDLIAQLPQAEMFGGTVQTFSGYPHLIHLMRGEVYDIPIGTGETTRCFVMGGASSTDKEYRIEGKNWWVNELPSEEEYERARRNLERADFSVDYVFTHTCPADYVEPTLYNMFLHTGAGGEADFDPLEEFLQWVEDHLDKKRLKRWYWAHFHDDMWVGDEQHVLLYEQIIPLGELPDERPVW